MTPDQIRIACAELDGWNLLDSDETDFYYPGGMQTVRKKKWHQATTNPLFLDGLRDDQLPNYPNSYDAIIPLIQKQSDKVRVEVESGILRQTKIGDLFRIPAIQLCEELLKAVGKYQ